jgi:hypothetical protein
MPAAASWDGEGVREAASGRDRAGQRDGEGATDRGTRFLSPTARCERRIVGCGFSSVVLFCFVWFEYFLTTRARGREGRRMGRQTSPVEI